MSGQAHAPHTPPEPWLDWHDPEQSIQIGVSRCLLGEAVRYDGGHKRSQAVTEQLATRTTLAAVCPEVELGMSVPRPPIHLVEEGSGTRLICPSTGEDFTDSMEAFARQRVDALRSDGLDGFVLKHGSPSCGTRALPVHRDGKPVHHSGQGLFARQLLTASPHLPVVEEGQLEEQAAWEHFIERVFCHHRWRLLVESGLTRRRLIAFHTAHKFQLLAHDETIYRRLGRALGSAGTMPDADLFAAYEHDFQRCLTQPTTTKRHVNVLQHALGHFKTHLASEERRGIVDMLEDLSAGRVPLSVPVRLFRQLIETHKVPWLGEQLYFYPHPWERELRDIEPTESA